MLSTLVFSIHFIFYCNPSKTSKRYPQTIFRTYNRDKKKNIVFNNFSKIFTARAYVTHHRLTRVLSKRFYYQTTVMSQCVCCKYFVNTFKIRFTHLRFVRSKTFTRIRYFFFLFTKTDYRRICEKSPYNINFQTKQF